MPRLVPPEKQRKKSFFSKFRKHNKGPSVGGDGNNGSGLVGVTTVPVLHAILGDDWQRFQRPGNNWYLPQSSSSSDAIILKLANILGTVYMMGGNVYTVTSSWDVFHVGTGYKQTYFTPAPWAFLMWPVIQAFMLGSCIYQFSYHGRDVIIDQVGWKLPLLQLMNAMYIRYRCGQRYKFAFIWIIVTYMIVNKIYRKINRIPSRGIRDQLFCHLPFSLYHGWILGLTFLACFEAFGVDAATTPAYTGTKTSVLFSLILIQLFERAYASPATEGDIVACIAVSWFLFAITVEQSAARSAFVHWSTHGFSTFSLCWITKCMIGLEMIDEGWRGTLDEDRAPLVGG